MNLMFAVMDYTTHASLNSLLIHFHTVQKLLATIAWKWIYDV